MASPVSSNNISTGRMIAAATILAAVGGGGTYLLLRPTLPEQVRGAFPALPDFKSEPTILQGKLQQAYTKTATSGSVADLAAYGRLLHANGFAAEASQAWQVLLSVDPTEPRWSYYLAHLRRDSGDMGETTLWLQQTVEINPNYRPAWLQLGDMALKSARFERARNYYGECLRLLPGAPYARIGLARIEQQEGKRDSAQKALLELVEDHPSFPSAHNLLAQMYRESGDQSRANLHRWEGYRAGRFITMEDPWMRELEIQCFTPAKLFIIGMMDFQANRGDRGQSAYEKAVQCAPKDPGNHELLGDLYRKLKEPQLARRSLSQSISLSDAAGVAPSLLAFIHLAAVEQELGEFQTSREVAERGRIAHPRSPEILVELGLTLTALGENEAAGVAFRDAIELSPHDTAAQFHLGEWWLRKDQTDQAIPHFEKSLVLQPTFAPALRYLLQYTLGTGQLDSAQDYADTLLGAYYGDSEVRQLVAICYLRLGRRGLERNAVSEAITHFQIAYDLDSDDVDIAFELGTLQLAQGEFKAATPPLEVLIANRPTDASAHLFLAQAYLMDGRPRAARALLEKGLTLAEQAGNAGTAGNIREMLEAITR